ncbi:uncharacterized protein TRIADDRAFT_60654 [Trichoplax adhaerens]|uniref:ABC transmembrane type-1 domain-containing protein n=1 Tax=Trichoplax adhaerens TaxID=10228 RepID=B3S8T2_TRIAD|nr:hypothetical protein TRIADDRAFT_60654 [Trichoplax adhaerens]EDV20940.1 hypothetical protein TRIADDRAFT_60654 [Trichoplax adhaerens]|eukprot:XP_002116584.1 hypothetical protein TRIADDRAFT_60654 [Trichoplax adhaerens]
MDQIYVMNKGLIVERGTYKTLTADGGAFSEVLQTFTKTDETPNKYVSSPVPNPKNRTGVIRIKSKSKDSFKKQLKREIKKKKIASNEEAMLGQVKMSVYLLYMKSIGFFLGISIVLFEIAGQACYAVSSFCHSNCSFGSERYRYSILARIKASDDFHFNLVHSVVNAPISFFDSTPIGRIIYRFSHDINGIDEVVPTMFSGFLSMSVSALMVIVVVSVSTPTFINSDCTTFHYIFLYSGKA